MSGPSRSTAKLREWYGRQSNMNERYNLPSDAREMRRLNKQFQAVILAMNGLYPESYAKVIRERLNNKVESVSIADFGSGSGDWASCMAKEFPHAQVIGLDLVPSSPPDAPSNVKYEVKDLNSDMSEYYGKFDMIQTRSMASGISDYLVFLENILRCLKPGGIYMYLNVFLFLYDEDLNRMKPVAGFNKLSYETLSVRDIYPNGVKTESWNDQAESWIREEPGFNNIHVENFYIPTGWEGSEKYCKQPERSGSLMREIIMDLASAWKPLLLSRGVPETQADSWIAEAKKELEVPGELRAYARWVAVCVQKFLE